MRNGITHENLGYDIYEYSDDDIKNINEVFVCFDFTCNLQCPHCTLRKIDLEHNFSKIYNTLKYIDKLNKNFTINLFGGEPMLLKDNELQIFNEFYSSHPLIISTNLLTLSEYKIKLMKNCQDVNTSWNPQRFTENQMLKWNEHLKIIQRENVPYTVMITLTKDLIDNYTPTQFCDIIKQWDKCRNIDLKQMIGDSNVDFNSVDEWLCNLYNVWNIKPKNLLFEEVERVANKQRIWKNYCETYFTILPNGNLKKGCPYFEYKTDKSFCLTCEYYPVCKGGCNIQEQCTFPKKLYEKIKDKNNESICNTII